VTSSQLSGAEGEMGVLNAQLAGLQRRLEVEQRNHEAAKRQAMDQ